MTLETLVTAVASRVSPSGYVDTVLAEATRISRGEPGSPQLLTTELLVIAGIIVQVCTIAIEVAKLVKGFREQDKQDQLVVLLVRLAERTGDPSITDDETIKRVATTVVEVLNEGHTQNSEKIVR